MLKWFGLIRFSRHNMICNQVKGAASAAIRVTMADTCNRPIARLSDPAMPSFLHAADLHLDSPLTGLEAYEGAPVEEIRGATRQALERLIGIALAESIDALLLAGDIYDGDWRDYSTGLFFAGQMARLKQAGIPVLMVQGNHDAASQISRHLRLPDNVHLFPSRHPTTLRLASAGLAIHGQSYATRQVEDNLARDYPPADPQLFNIGLLHSSLDGRPGHANYAPCHLDDLRRLGYDYWALGHVHQREIVAQDPWVVFPGNLQGRHARETGAKGATLVQVRAGRVQSLEHHALDVVRWARCDIDIGHSPGHEERIETRISAVLEAEFNAADGRLLALRLRLHGQTRQDAQLRANAEQLLNQCRVLAFEIGGRGIWIEKLIIDTRLPFGPAPPEPADALAALTPLLASLADPTSVLTDQAEYASLASGLLEDADELRRKLPVSAHSDEDALDLSPASLAHDDGDLHQCLRAAHALLLERLRGEPVEGLGHAAD